MNMYKMLIVIGAVLVLVGMIGALFGKLPGDFSFKKGNVSFHFPLMTSIIVSVILSAIFYFFTNAR